MHIFREHCGDLNPDEGRALYDLVYHNKAY